MNYNIIATDDFKRDLKQLSKKYYSIANDYANLLKDLYANPTIGDKLDENTRKVRMAITSKNKGKSGGARVITCSVLVNVESTDIYLLTIYDKSEQKSITTKKLQTLKQINGLL